MTTTTVLVAAASRHGSTDDLAILIGSVLADALGPDAWSVDVRRFEDVDPGAVYDAFVLGSAVYMGRWLKPAREFVRARAAELRNAPTWLFTSGPIGDPPRPVEESPDSLELATLVHARDHVVFAGKVTKGELGLAERVTVRAVGATYGDFRDLDAVVAWAAGIAQVLSADLRLQPQVPEVPSTRVLRGQPQQPTDATLEPVGTVPPPSQVRQS